MLIFISHCMQAAHMQDKSAAAKLVQQSSQKAPCGMMLHKFVSVPRVDLHDWYETSLIKQFQSDMCVQSGFLPTLLPSHTQKVTEINWLSIKQKYILLYLHGFVFTIHAISGVAVNKRAASQQSLDRTNTHVFIFTAYDTRRLLLCIFSFWWK